MQNFLGLYFVLKVPDLSSKAEIKCYDFVNRVESVKRTIVECNI